MKQFLILVSLIALINCWTYPLVQYGYGMGAQNGAPANHILMSKQDVNRQYTVPITFLAPFSNNLPVIVLGQSLLDIKQGLTSYGYRCDVKDVTATGFNVVITALTKEPVYGVLVNWFAIDDPRFFTVQLDSNTFGSLGSLNSGASGNRTETFTVNFPQTGLEGKQVQGTVLPTGITFRVADPVNTVFTNVIAVTSNSITFSVNTGATNQISYIQLSFLITAVSPNIYLTTAGTNSAPTSEWQTGQGDRWVTSTLTVPANLRSGPVAFLTSMTGQSSELKTNEIMINSLPLRTGATPSLQYGTWQKGKPYQIYQSILLYKSDSFQVFSKDCAELYSECNFTGQHINLCGKNMNIPGNGFNYTIKSISIPQGKSVTLYNRIGLEGKQVTFTTTQPCLNSLEFKLYLTME